MDSFTPEGEFREAQRLGRLGHWSWRLATDEIVWSAELYRIFGVDEGTRPPAFQEHSGLVSAESWPRLQQAVDRLLGEGHVYSVELEYCTSAGHTGWVEARGEPIRDARGTIVGLRGTCLEITERVRRVRAEVELQLEVRAKQDRAALVRRFSEQIRTALNGVTGYANLLKQIHHGDAKQLRWVNGIIGSSDDIVAFLNGLEGVSDMLFAAHATRRSSGADRQWLHDLAESMPFPVLVHDRRGTILQVNRKLIEATGYTRAELPTRAEWAARAYRDDDATEIASRLRTAFSSGQPADGGCRWVHTKSGEKRLWHLFAAPSGIDDVGEPIIMSLGVDVTDRIAPEMPAAR